MQYNSFVLDQVNNIIFFSHNIIVAQTEVQCTIECHDQFYCENNFCKPRCDGYEEHSHSYTVATDVLILVLSSIGMVTGLAGLVISCLRYKHM